MNRIISKTAVVTHVHFCSIGCCKHRRDQSLDGQGDRDLLTEIGPQFERTTGDRLNISTDLPAAFLRRADAGEPFDILISGSSPVDEWIKDGKIIADTRTDIARSGIGVEVRAGTRKPASTSSARSRRRYSLFANGLVDGERVG